VFISRAPAPDDRWLYLKLASFVVGAGLALLGLALRNDLLVTIAIIVLALGVVLRFLVRPAPSADTSDEP
jgi:hypothetical protein